MNPSDNLELATFLHKRPRGAPIEASIRCACGRAYYAAFIVARDALLRARIPVGNQESVHARTIALLKSTTDTDLAAAAGLLDQLRTTRRRADYALGAVRLEGQPFTEKRSQVALMQAAQIIRDIAAAAKRDAGLSIPHPMT